MRLLRSESLTATSLPSDVLGTPHDPMSAGGLPAVEAGGPTAPVLPIYLSCMYVSGIFIIEADISHPPDEHTRQSLHVWWLALIGCFNTQSQASLAFFWHYGLAFVLHCSFPWAAYASRVSLRVVHSSSPRAGNFHFEPLWYAEITQQFHYPTEVTQVVIVPPLVRGPACHCVSGIQLVSAAVSDVIQTISSAVRTAAQYRIDE
jgi:hypothetical protein